MTSAPPEAVKLGAAVQHEWDLDPAFPTVNHGSFGATPRVVLAEADAAWLRISAAPDSDLEAFDRRATLLLRKAAAVLT